MDSLEALLAISPIDGRYRSKTSQLKFLFSEYGLILNRLIIGAKYFQKLIKTIGHRQFEFDDLRWTQFIQYLEKDKQTLYINGEDVTKRFSYQYVSRCKEIEAKTNHDVASVVQCLKEIYIEDHYGDPFYEGWVHLGLTSQDLNTYSYVRDVVYFQKEIMPKQIQFIVDILCRLKYDCFNKYTYMLAMTHGQPATPTTIENMLQVFLDRIYQVTIKLTDASIQVKFGGATGGFNAHRCIRLDIDWQEFADELMYPLVRSQATTQVESYDTLAGFLAYIDQFNRILYDLAQDMWHYISRGIFKLKVVSQEVGSTAMAHKVNPIDFENGMANIDMSDAFSYIFQKRLPVSFMQRDLRDSSMLRNIGVMFGHSLIAWQSIHKGLSKLELNEAQLKKEIDDNIVVSVEGVQTMLRYHGHTDAYNTLKTETRGKEVTKESLIKSIDNLQLEIAELEENLKKIVTNPEEYFRPINVSK